MLMYVTVLEMDESKIFIAGVQEIENFSRQIYNRFSNQNILLQQFLLTNSQKVAQYIYNIHTYKVMKLSDCMALSESCMLLDGTG